MRNMPKKTVTDDTFKKSASQLLESMEEGVLVTDGDANILYANQGFHEITGFTPNEVIGEEVTDVVKELMKGDTPEQTIDLFRRNVLKKGEGINVTMGSKKGEKRCINLESSFLEGEKRRDMIFISFKDITGIKDLEKTLRKREKKLKKTLIFESTSEHIIYHDRDHRVIWANKAAADSVGEAPEDLKGRMCYKVWGYQDRPCDDCPVTKALKTEEIERGEIESPDGRYWFIPATPVKDDGGKIEGVVEVSVDLTERREIERELEEKHRQMKTILSNMPGMAYRCLNDKDWTMKFVSEGCKELTGYEPENLLKEGGTSYGDLIIPEDKDMVLDKIQSFLDKREPFEITYRIKTKDDRTRWMWERGVGIYSDQGELKFIEGLITDITERKEAKKRFQTIINKAPEGIIAYDEDGDIILANPKASELLGYSKDGLNSMNICQIDPSVKKDDHGLFWNDRPLDDLDDIESEHVKKDGSTYPARITINRMILDGQKMTLGFFLDITERKEAKHALRERNKKIKRLHEKAMEFEKCKSKEKVSELVVEASENILDLDVSSIDFVEDDRFVVKATVRGALEKGTTYPIEGIAGKTFRDDESFLIQDLDEEEEAVPRKESYRSAISIPVGDVGVFQALSEERCYFDETDLELAEILINHAAEAINRLRYEEELKRSKKRFETLISKAQEGIYIRDLDGKITYVNEKFADIHGYDRDELIGKRSSNLLHPDSRKEFESLEEYDNGSLNMPEEIKIVRKDGETRYVSNIISIIESDEGKKEVFGLVRDITERKENEEKIEHLNNLLRSIRQINQLIDQEEDLFELMKRSRESMINNRGYSDVSILLMSQGKVNKKIGSIGIDDIDSKIDELKRKKKTLIIEEDGSTTVLVPMMDKYMEGVLAVDIVGEVDEEELGLLEETAGDLTVGKNKIESEEKLKRSLREKEVLLDEVHHRVKNNLQVISSMLKLQASRENKEMSRVLQEGQSRIQCMALIHEMLHRSEDVARVGLNQYIDELVRTIYRTYDIGHDVELETDLEYIELGMDQANPCVQAIHEVVSNALQHAFPEDHGERGKLKISSSLTDDGMVEMIISDNGVGLPEDMDIRDTKTIGLRLVHMLVEDQLDGHIELNRDGGTTFKIRFEKESESYG